MEEIKNSDTIGNSGSSENQGSDSPISAENRGEVPQAPETAPEIVNEAVVPQAAESAEESPEEAVGIKEGVSEIQEGENAKEQSFSENTPYYPQEFTPSPMKSVERFFKVVITILVIILVAWAVHRENKIEERGIFDIPSNVKISVDDTEKQGKVTIIEDTGERFIGQNMPAGSQVGVIPGTTTSASSNGSKIKVTTFYNKGGDCTKVFPLVREAEKKYDSDLVNTIRQLLMPLSAEESAQGYVSRVPLGTMLSSIKMNDGIAVIRFNSALTSVSGSCAATGLRLQIEQTARQFPYVKSVVICAGDNCDQNKVLK